MELRTLRYFVAVADAGSVNAAAQRLHLTQPSLARQLHRLERRLNLTLLEPQGGRLVLTSAGRAFLPHARDLLAQAEAASAAVAELAAGLIPSLRLAASPLVVSLVVAPSIAELGPEDACPRIVTDADLSYDRLDCDVDLVLATTPPAPGLDRLRFPRLPITAQLPADHPLAGQNEIGLAQLAGESVLLAADSSDVQTRLTGLLVVAGLTPATASTVDTGQLAQALAASGRGVAVVTDEPRFDLVSVPIIGDDRASLAIEVYAAWKPEHHAAPMVAACARRLQRSTAARLDRRRAGRAPRSESAA